MTPTPTTTNYGSGNDPRANPVHPHHLQWLTVLVNIALDAGIVILSGGRVVPAPNNSGLSVSPDPNLIEHGNILDVQHKGK
jgi:hypothetical protein